MRIDFVVSMEFSHLFRVVFWAEPCLIDGGTSVMRLVMKLIYPTQQRMCHKTSDSENTSMAESMPNAKREISL